MAEGPPLQAATDPLFDFDELEEAVEVPWPDAAEEKRSISTSDAEGGVAPRAACRGAVEAEAAALQEPSGTGPRGYTLPSAELARPDAAAVALARAKAWTLEERTWGRLWLHKPPLRLQLGEAWVRNPVASLAECADETCKNNRMLRPTVRPRFLQLCRRALDARLARGLAKSRPVVYASLGSGGLYFDWEFLEDLIQDGYKVSSIHLVDREYKSSWEQVQEHPDVASALRAFVSWFSLGGSGGGTSCSVRVHASFEDLCAHLRAGGAPLPDVVMQCDAQIYSIKSPVQVAPIIREGGLYLRLREGKVGQLALWKPLRAEIQETSNGAQGPASPLLPGVALEVLEVYPKPKKHARKAALQEGRLWAWAGGSPGRLPSSVPVRSLAPACEGAAARAGWPKGAGPPEEDFASGQHGLRLVDSLLPLREREELVAEGPPIGTWLPLHELQLKGPLPGGRPQWVDLSKLQSSSGPRLEQVRCEPPVRSSASAPAVGGWWRRW